MRKNLMEEGRNIIKDLSSALLFLFSFILISAYVPILGFFVIILIPLPIVFYSLKLGRNYGLVIITIGIIFTALILKSYSFDIFFLSSFLLLGFILAEFLKQNLNLEKTVIYTATSSLIILLLTLLYYSYSKAVALDFLFLNYISNTLKLILEQYNSMGITDESVLIIQNSMEILKYVLLYLSPSFIIIFYLIISFIELLIVSWFFKRKKIFFPDFGDLKNWRASEKLVWLLILSSLLVITFKSKTVSMIGLNVLIILTFVYFLQGISIITYYFNKKSIPSFLKIIFFAIIFLQQILMLFVAIMGLFDNWFDFRKVKQEKSLNN